MLGKLSQFAIAVALLGAVIMLIGLFPGLTGLEITPGFGILKTLTVFFGFSLFLAGGYLFVQATFYPNVKHTLAQQIGTRLILTGLVISAASGLADVFGYGSHPAGSGLHPVFGPYKFAGFVGGFFVASMGIVIFALMGPKEPPKNDGESGNDL